MFACACSAAAWAQPFAWALGVPASLWALAWGWKHSGLTLEPMWTETITTTTTKHPAPEDDVVK